jgi:hypothetical protein
MNNNHHPRRRCSWSTVHADRPKGKSHLEILELSASFSLPVVAAKINTGLTTCATSCGRLAVSRRLRPPRIPGVSKLLAFQLGMAVKRLFPEAS